MQIKKIGVIGAGQMGNGIAHVLSLGGYHVLLNDINKGILGKASQNIEKISKDRLIVKKFQANKVMKHLN